MFSRYSNNAQYVLNLDCEKGFAFYCKAIEKTREDKLFARWINGYQSEISFDEFKKECLITVSNPQITNSIKSVDEILKNVENILRKD